MREWKAVTGQSIKVEFVEIKDGRAVLKTPEGVVTPPLDSLTPESRELAVSIYEKKERARIARLTPAQLISAIEPRNYTPPGNTVAARFDNPEFDLYVYQPSGIALIFVKEGGAYLSEPLRLSLALYYHDPAKVPNDYVPRNSLKALEVNQTQKGVFTIKRQHVDEVVTDVYLQIGKTSVTAGYKVQDPAGIKFPSRHRFVVASPSTYAISPDADGIPTFYHNPRVAAEGVPRDQLLKMMASWKIDFRPKTKVDGVPTSFSYTPSVQRFPAGGLASMMISGGVYGDNKVTVSPIGSNGGLSAWIYPGKSPMDGYGIYFRKEDGTSAPNAPDALLKIEVQ
jgi:hypothetical protein